MAEFPYGEAEQKALIVEAQGLVDKFRVPEAATNAEILLRIQFSLVDWTNSMAEKVARARQLRSFATRAQALYEVESGETKVAIDASDDWYQTLIDAVNFGVLRNVPEAARFQQLVLRHDLSDDSFQAATFDYDVVMGWFDELVGLEAICLDDQFAEKGKALLAAVYKERKEANEALMRRQTATYALSLVLDEIRALFALYDAARTMAMRLFKVELPGFDLTLLKGSAANPAPRAAAPAPAANPSTNADAPVANPTGL